MRCMVVLKSGVIIEMSDMSKEEINRIRYIPDTGTIGFGPDDAFIQRSEIAAIIRLTSVIKMR